MRVLSASVCVCGGGGGGGGAIKRGGGRHIAGRGSASVPNAPPMRTPLITVMKCFLLWDEVWNPM